MKSLARAGATVLFSVFAGISVVVGGPAHAAPDAARITTILAAAGLEDISVEAMVSEDALAIAPGATLVWRGEKVTGTLTTVPIAEPLQSVEELFAPTGRIGVGKFEIGSRILRSSLRLAGRTMDDLPFPRTRNFPD